MPAGLSPVHLLVILVVALVVLGPEKMPDAVRKAARVLGEARRLSTRAMEDLESTVSMHMQDPSPPTVENAPTYPGAGSGATALPEPEPVPVDAPPADTDARLADRPRGIHDAFSQATPANGNPSSSPSTPRSTAHPSSFAKEPS